VNTITSGGTGVIDTQSLSLGFTYTPTETLKIDFSGGGQFNQVSNPGATISFEPLFGDGAPRSFNTNSHSSSFSEILSAEATKRFERGEFGFSYSKSLSPNLLGLLISSERYAFSGRYSVNQNLTSSFRLAVTDTATGGGGGSSATAQFYERALFEIGSGLIWTLTEHLDVSANYQYKQIEYPSLQRDAEDHAVFLRLQYIPDQKHY
jgi:long-subunit fatty acid transport protein